MSNFPEVEYFLVEFYKSGIQTTPDDRFIVARNEVIFECEEWLDKHPNGHVRVSNEEEEG